MAEAERFGQALGMFDQAIELTPKRRELHELKAQALLALAQDFRAVQVRPPAAGCLLFVASKLTRGWFFHRPQLKRQY